MVAGDACLVLALVGQQGTAVGVADDVQPPAVHAGRTQVVVHLHVPTGLEADGVQAQVVGQRTPADGDEDLVTGHGPAVLQGRRDGRVVGGPFGLHHPGAGDDRDPHLLQRVLELLTGEDFLARDQPILHLHDGDLLAAEPPHRLGHLDADHPATEDDQAGRDLLGLGDVAVGPAPDIAQPVDRRNRRPRADADDHALLRDQGADTAVLGGDLDGPLPRQPAVTADEVHAGRVHPFDLARVVQARAEGVPSGQRLVDVDLARDGSPCTGNPTECRKRLARTQQGLGRHAAPVGALAAHELLLDDGDPQSGLHRPVPCVLSGRPCADDDDVVGLVHWVLLTIAGCCRANRPTPRDVPSVPTECTRKRVRPRRGPQGPTCRSLIGYFPGRRLLVSTALSMAVGGALSDSCSVRCSRGSTSFSTGSNLPRPPIVGNPQPVQWRP